MEHVEGECFGTSQGGTALTEHPGFACGSRAWALHSRGGARGPGTVALLPKRFWMMWLDKWELLSQLPEAPLR